MPSFREFSTLLLSIVYLLVSVRAESTQRPFFKSHPLQPAKPIKINRPRGPVKRCVAVPNRAETDDAPCILEAFQRCNNGGTVVLDSTYTIASPLDLTFLNDVDVAISGTIKVSDDISSWKTISFKYAYQNASAIWRFGGNNVHIYGAGKGAIDGQGQAWYDAFAQDPLLQRPVLFVLDGLQGGSVTGLRMRNPPFWFNLIANSSDVLVSDVVLNVESNSRNPAKNTDGWDTYRSDNIVIQNSVVHNSDDCVSFKPNSTNILVQGLACYESHGISVGSLGQYINEYDIVENVYVYNISMTNASDGARIKVWPGTFTDFQLSLFGGGGSGYVKNVTYDTLYNNNNDWAVEVTQCYGTKSQALCNKHPSSITISDITFKNIWGTTSSKHDPKVGTLVCSERSKCKDIRAYNITVKPRSGKKAQWVCTNIDNQLVDVDCTTKE